MKISKYFVAITFGISFVLLGCNTPIPNLEFSVDNERSLEVFYKGNSFTGIQKELFILGQSVALEADSRLFVEVPFESIVTVPDSITIDLFSSVMVEESNYDSPLSTHRFQIPQSSSPESRALRLVFRSLDLDESIPVGGLDIQALRISTPTVPLVGLGITDEVENLSELRITDTRIVLNEGASYEENFFTHAQTGQVTSNIFVTFAQIAGRDLVLNYDYFPPANRLVLEPGEESTIPQVSLKLATSNPTDDSYQTYLRLHPGSQRIVVSSSSYPLNPNSLLLTNFEAGFSLRGVELRPSSTQVGRPIEAEFGTILRYPMSAWRGTNYELFSWTLYPEVLIIDFRDRDTQKRYLDRLAFFVEKRGTTGRLLTNTQLEGRHGWNAHNYRGQGLADFYNAAENLSFTLNPEEVELRELVSQWGIIERATSSSSWEPGVGGILSLTRDPRESGASRALFLTHEGLHGIYYMNSKLVSQAQAEWQNLSPDVRTYLTRYFGYLQYETQDLYLMENEFQAYMLQQPLQEVRWVFGSLYRDRLIRAYPAEEAFFTRVAPIAAQEFYDAAFRLQSLLFQEYGLLGGNLHSLVPGSF